MVWRALMDVMVTMTSSIAVLLALQGFFCSWGPSSLFCTPVSSIVAIVVDCFLVSHTCLYSFYTSVKTNIFLVDLYSADHEYIFGGHESSFRFCTCTHVFVYFEYIQIFVFSLHSTPAHALIIIIVRFSLNGVSKKPSNVYYFFCDQLHHI